MKKILVVNDFPVFPVVHGGKVRILNIYNNISSKFQVTYVCLGDNPKIVTKTISENFREISVPKTFFYKLIILLAKKIMGIAVDDLVALFFAGFNFHFKKIIKEEISKSDIVIFCHPYMYPALKPFIEKKTVIYEALNVEYALKKSILKDGLLKNIMLHRLKKCSQNLLTRSDLCFAMSEEDKLQFSQVYDVTISKFRIAPNGVDVNFYADVYQERITRNESGISVPLIIFMGSGHPPNVEAAWQIVRDIAPRHPRMNFIIAGSVCGVIRTEKRGKNVHLTDFIPDEEKKELFKIADIAVNPMISGSGTNLKMFDYMAAGIPIISTPVGARGINLNNGIHAIVCDIDSFPNEIFNLVNDTDLLKTLSQNGRNLAKDQYDWKNIADSMINSIEDVFEEKENLSL